MKKNECIEQAIQEKRNLHPAYSGMSDQRLLGMLLAEFFEWNGYDLLETSFYALEGANFYQEADLVSTLFTSDDSAELARKMLATVKPGA